MQPEPSNFIYILNTVFGGNVPNDVEVGGQALPTLSR